jgi:two-component system chemotaxis sensor kinase CheA
MFDAEDLALYLDEGEENLTALENGLLALRRGEDTEIDLLFRAAHTLKGSSAMMGIQPVAELAHALESVLDRVRRGVLTRLSEALLAAALAAVDFVRQAFEALRSGGEVGETPEELVRRLEEGSEEDGQGAGQAAPAAAHAAPRRDAAFTVVFRPDAFTNVRAYQLLERLREEGVAADATPSLADIEADRVGDRVRLAVAVEDLAEALRLAREIPDVLEVALEAEPWPRGVERHEEGGAASATPEPRRAAEAAPERIRGAEGAFVRVDLGLMDRLMNLTGELVINRGRLNAIVETAVGSEAGREIRAVSQAIQHITGEIQEIVLAARMTPLTRLFARFPRVVADTARELGKEVRLITEGEDTLLDRSLIDVIVDPITHLLRNAVDHGVEEPARRLAVGKPAEGKVTLRAYRTESSVVLEVEDDGGGIDPHAVAQAAERRGLLGREQLAAMSPEELQMLVFAPGFSTRGEVSAISGRGVGMDIVRTNVEGSGGRVELRSEVGRGTLVRLVLPFTLATARTLLVDVAGRTLAVPLMAIDQVVELGAARLRTLDGGREVALIGAATMPVLRAEAFYVDRPASAAGPGLSEPGAATEGSVDEGDGRALVVLNVRGRHLALLVDGLVREEEVVVKPIDRLVGRTEIFAGAAILGDGRIALIVSPEGLFRDRLAGARLTPLRAGSG